MASVFSKIIAGELPARFIWQDDTVVAFLSIAPLRPGHTLVVPRQEVDDWTTVSGDVLAHCVSVAQRIGQAAKQAFDAPRAALVIAGFEVPHLHVHVYPAYGLPDFDMAKARPASDVELDAAAHRLRAALG